MLNKVPDISDPQLDVNNRRNQILGEASFLRAYHYYQLVKMWGGVPLITAPVESTAPGETQIPRATIDELYAQIIADLESAVTRYNRQPLFTRLLGDAYMRNGQLQKALDMYRRALDQL